MLVLSRKTYERILIGPDIVVTVQRIGPNNVRLGIEAPTDINIARAEIALPANAKIGFADRLANRSIREAS